MIRFVVSLVAVLALVACTNPGTRKEGRAVFRISDAATSTIQFRHLDAVNALRQAKGLKAVELSAELNAAAATHARDMALQNRPWHFGSDGSSPVDRVRRAGYPGILSGENISETFEDDFETLEAWMQNPLNRDVILASNADDMGIMWFQEPRGKIWWVQVFGTRAPVVADLSQ